MTTTFLNPGATLTGSLIVDLELLLGLGVLLCLFFFFTVRRPVVGAVGFIFLVLTRVHEFIPNAHILRPSIIVGVLMLAGLFLFLYLNREAIYFSAPQSWILLAFIMLCWVSLFTKAGTVYDPYGRILIEPLLLVLVVFFALQNAVRNFRDFRIVLIALAWCGLTITLLALIQSFITGVAHGRGALWLYQSGEGEIRRVGGLGLHPNDLPVTLAALLPVYFFFLDQEKRSPFLRAISLCAIPVATLTAFSTYTRGGFLCLAAAFFLIFSKRVNAKYTIGFVFLMMIIAVLVPDAFWERLGSTLTTDTTGTGRLFIYQAALNMIQANPFTGVGYGQFYYLYSYYGGQLFDFVSPHSTYLGIAAETGIFNLAIFLCLPLVAFLDLHQLKFKARTAADFRTVQLVDTLNASLIIALISGLTLDQSSWLLFYVGLALVVILKRIYLKNYVPQTVPFKKKYIKSFQQATL